eukprot:CAMPEP_0194271194 /NCGR_PEP_ID=MMETSP0169-20130528/5036_1 /TAXON_ID=218684 /ORGANISM="Corethron pennatum, Strain L29A3" /LENGTH=319 /DNA_ID=CAMNT_0039013487 /DNA_START=684 /DNA_END=1640 /DNA_ORIENTATION=+
MKQYGSSRRFNDMDEMTEVPIANNGTGEIEIPTVIVIGTQKGGTDALNAFMKLHPDMITSKRKEPHWFDWRLSPNETSDGRIPEKDKYAYLKAYREHAFNITDIRSHLNKTTMEKTPLYIFDLKAAYRIKSVLPKAKIIALLRDPVERAYSHYKMDYLKHRKQNRTFEDCIETDIDILKETGVLSQNESAVRTNLPGFDKAWAQYVKIFNSRRRKFDSIVGRGIYAAQLRRWFKVYNKEERMKQFFVMKSEDFRPDKYGRVDITDMTRFIGVSDKNFTEVKKIHGTRDIGPMQNKTKARLRRLYKPFNDELYKLLGPGW